MADSVPPAGRSLPRSMVEAGVVTLGRLASFYVFFVGILAWILLYIFTVIGAQAFLDAHFRSAVERAIRVSPVNGPVIPQIQERVSDLLENSVWTRFGRVRVNVSVFAADGRTPLYLGGRTVPPPPDSDPTFAWEEAFRLLPAAGDVVVSVPHDALLAVAILVFYGAITIQGLFLYNRAAARREDALLATAVAARDATAERAGSIERELSEVRRRLGEVEPVERAHAEEIRELQRERERLQQKLGDLAEREAALRTSAARSTELEQERQALEELLEEAVEDLGEKESEIHALQARLKRASKSETSGGRGRAAEQLARRLRTLYKNLDVDDRAIQDMVALRDETMKLKAEEGLKRLADDPHGASIRRKVGGLPPQLSIFELGFAGKGRIYYTRGSEQRYRVLAIGAKNTQKTDLEYLSRLPTG